jgi:hypothetical protein
VTDDSSIDALMGVPVLRRGLLRQSHLHKPKAIRLFSLIAISGLEESGDSDSGADSNAMSSLNRSVYLSSRTLALHYVLKDATTVKPLPTCSAIGRKVPARQDHQDH